jgi:hypothetical protein
MSQQPHLPHIDETPAATGPVTCLGLTFPDDAARRAYFSDRLAEHLQDPAFRQIEGFPIGADEEILALSDPPYYTACPNPFLAEIIAQWQQEWEETRGRLGLPADGENGAYQREPFAADVSEGKNDPIYNAHSYHTKVPHKAIMRYILHYTDPGDIVFDGFCGTGMTGVAAQLCGDRKAVESLGYHVDPDGLIYDHPPLPTSSFIVPPSSFPISRLGPRKAVLNNLSPAATFIAYNYNTPVDAAAFETEAGTPAGAWDFVRQHLARLPAVVLADGGLETIAERQDYLLFDRMVAFHIQRGATVPLSAAEFYAGLRSRFVERDGMFFLPDQTPAYDQARLQAGQVAQLTLFVNDEKSSIQWLRQQLDPALGGRPQTYQDLQPQFLRQLRQARHEELPELTVLLEQNFLQDDQGRWYVPDPNKASDLEALRHRALLREFRSTLDGKKRLKQFRTEAIRAGFAQAWRERDFAVIVAVAERLPEQVLQEDAELLMYYDNASLRVR